MCLITNCNSLRAPAATGSYASFPRRIPPLSLSSVFSPTDFISHSLSFLSASRTVLERLPLRKQMEANWSSCALEDVICQQPLGTEAFHALSQRRKRGTHMIMSGSHVEAMSRLNQSRLEYNLLILANYHEHTSSDEISVFPGLWSQFERKLGDVCCRQSILALAVLDFLAQLQRIGRTRQGSGLGAENCLNFSVRSLSEATTEPTRWAGSGTEEDSCSGDVPGRRSDVPRKIFQFAA